MVVLEEAAPLDIVKSRAATRPPRSGRQARLSRCKRRFYAQAVQASDSRHARHEGQPHLLAPPYATNNVGRPRAWRQNVQQRRSGAGDDEAECSQRRQRTRGRGGQAARAACGPHKGRKGGVKIAGDEQQQRPQAQVPAAERAARRPRRKDRRAAPRKGRRRARAPPAFDAARRRRAAFTPPLCRPVGRRQDGDGDGLVRGLTRQLRARQEF